MLPASWDLRRPLSPGQKSYLTKQQNKYSEIVRRPKEFTLRRVNKDNQRILKASGFKVTQDGRAILPTKGTESIHVRRGKLVTEYSDKTEEILLRGQKNFLRQLEKMERKKLAPNQAYGLKIGNSPSAVFTRTTLKELIGYARHMKFHSPSGHNYVSLVLITYKREHVVKSLNAKGKPK